MRRPLKTVLLGFSCGFQLSCGLAALAYLTGGSQPNLAILLALNLSAMVLLAAASLQS